MNSDDAGITKNRILTPGTAIFSKDGATPSTMSRVTMPAPRTTERITTANAGSMFIICAGTLAGPGETSQATN